MYFKDIGYLCKPKDKLDSMRHPTKGGYEKREVFCNEIEGVRRTEFYQAQAAGFKPQITVEIPISEYEREKYFEYDGVMYQVLRSYPTGAERLELVLTTEVKNNVV